MKVIEVDRQKLRGAIWGKRRKIADAVGLHPNSVSRKIHGQQPLTIDELNEIAKYLKQDTMEFLKEVDEEEELTLQERRSFMELPVEERKRIMEEQAGKIKEHYEQDTEWKELQGGDIVEY